MKAITFIEALDDPKLLKPWTAKLDLSAWRIFHAAVDGLEIDSANRLLFMKSTRRTTFPTSRAVEAYAAVGRRGGKSANAALRAVYECAIRTSWREHLAPGQVAIFPIISVDRQSSQEVFRYVSGILHSSPLLRGMIESESKEEIAMKNRSVIQVRVASFRSVRGPSYIGAVLDELAFFRDLDTSSNPTAEIIAALTPGILPGGLLLGISSVFARQGYLWQMSERHFGKDGDVLFWRAPTLTMNPGFDKQKIARERAKDAARASSEYDSEWREDLMGLYSSEAVDQALAPHGDLPFVPGVKYFAFVDPSGGRRDSAALGIAHLEKDGRIVVDMATERKAPHDPHAVVKEFAVLLKAYHLDKVTGDRYGGEWPVQAFKKQGITYNLAEKTASELYLAALPLFSGGILEFPGSDRLRGQLCSLLRRTTASGRDSVIAGQSDRSHADLANAAIGAAVLASSTKKGGAFGAFTEFDFYGEEGWGINHDRLLSELNDH
ncbi:MAG: hypothetical protein ABII93_06110 [Chrysiogenia bacterium]